MRLDSRTRVVAHRGFSAQAPENTVAAIRRAIEIGADMAEFDVTVTADGHVICLHDETLDRTTDGRGAATDRTLAEIRRLDAGSWFAAEFAGEPVPTLAEMLDVADGRILLNVEIKPEAVSHGVVDAVARLIRDRKMVDRVVVSSFAPEALRQMKVIAPEIVTISLFNDELHDGRDPLEIVMEVGSRGLNLSADRATAELVGRCRAHGLPVGVYTVNSKRRMNRMIALGVHAIFTDRPDRLIGVLAVRSDAPSTAPGA